MTALQWVGLKANLKAACSAAQRASPKAVHLEHRKAESRGDQWAVSKVCRWVDWRVTLRAECWASQSAEWRVFQWAAPWARQWADAKAASKACQWVAYWVG